MTAFEEMGVLPEIAKAVDEMEWTLPTDVQADAIPLILGGGDVLMAAETGSGKTGAFCLPILQIVWETLKDSKEGKYAGTSSGAELEINSKWGLSAFDRGKALAVTQDGLKCQSREQKEWHGCRATKGVYGKGKYYFEAIVADEGLCRVGWSTEKASLELGTDRLSFGFGGTGKKSHNKNFDDYGEAFGQNDVIGNLLDLERLLISFLKNGENLGEAFRIPGGIRNETFFPAVVLKNAEMHFNFGGEPFKYEPPEGYTPLTQAFPSNTKVNTNGINEGNSLASSRPSTSKGPQALIIEPSRELADQTYTQIQTFARYLESPSIRNLLVVGGVPVGEQIVALKEGVNIVVGTPGRIEELIGTGNLKLSDCRFFILDEADGLLKAGSSNFINRVHSQIPKMTPDGKRLQMIVCSATLHDFEVKKLSERLMYFPTWVDLKGQDAVPETVHHVVVRLDPESDRLWESLKHRITTDGVHFKDNINPRYLSPETLSEASKILKAEYCIRAIDKFQMDQAIIFCRTKLDCDNLEQYFNFRSSGNSKPYTCVCLHADRHPQERKSNLETFKQKKTRFLICTDVAARGIDISGLPFMINITLPDDKSNYVHRIGRVGRAERMGLAISLVSIVKEKVWYHQWCKSKGKNCHNTDLIDVNGCCIWYNEMQCLDDIEEHLGVTIQQVDKEINIPYDEFDGKVVYGQKQKDSGVVSNYHMDEVSTSLANLTALEKQAQSLYLKRYFGKA